MAMGAIIGVTSWQKSQERIKGPDPVTMRQSYQSSHYPQPYSPQAEYSQTTHTSSQSNYPPVQPDEPMLDEPIADSPLAEDPAVARARRNAERYNRNR